VLHRAAGRGEVDGPEVAGGGGPVAVESNAMVAGQVLGGPTAAEVADGVGGDRRQTLLAVAFGVLSENLAEAVPLFVVQDPGDLGQLVDDLLLGSFIAASVGGCALGVQCADRDMDGVGDHGLLVDGQGAGMCGEHHRRPYSRRPGRAVSQPRRQRIAAPGPASACATAR